jgi:hypothetical protein
VAGALLLTAGQSTFAAAPDGAPPAARQTVAPQLGLLPLAITFRDVAAGGGAGITYRRAPSPRLEVFNQIKQKPIYKLPEDFIASPLKPRGAPGVALFDFDNDRDLDIYVTNGPGRANSLYSNQLGETGALRFVDVAVAAGVAATDQDSQGVCAGDIDNDGDKDLYVLGNDEPNRLFENRGDGTFADITAASGAGGGTRTPTACSMGDVNGDGRLDIAVANSYDNWDNMLVYGGNPFPLTEPNELFLNQGDNHFVAAGASSGFASLEGLPEGAAMLTWAIAVADVDLDGDADILTADDQTVFGPTANGGLDVGFVRLYRNDGTGQFDEVTFDVGLDRFGAWMGLAFGDINCDGHVDFFSTNMGNYTAEFVGAPFAGADWSSRWFLGQADGTFSDPGVGALAATPFGWGTSIFDFDNDADQDIIFHGGNDFSLFVDSSNGGGLLENQGCSASFTRNQLALASGANHDRRDGQGVAVGDLDDNGFDDIVSVSSFDVPLETLLIPYPIPPQGSPFDVDANLVPVFFPTATPGEFTYSGFDFVEGTLAVEVNSASNGNRWLQVTTLGTRKLTPQGRVNRDGIGAVVKVTPAEGKSVLRPVVGGGSYGSQDSLTGTFGLGSASSATVEVLWPGRVRNRLYGVGHEERLVFPEIPCSFDGPRDRHAYSQCVGRALGDLREAGILSRAQAERFFRSALRAFDEG